jgi:uncharacterized NAD(P)/FAD-binding protein YdhS
MKFDIIFVGGGFGSSRGLSDLLLKLRKKKYKKKINIGVLEEDINNIPGGIAYSERLSKHGFFNNPSRLSPKEFTSWSIKNKNVKMLFQDILTSGSISFNEWMLKNKDVLEKAKNIQAISEIYYPRFYLSLWLKDILLKEVKLKNKNIKIFFINGSANVIKKKGNNFLISIKNGKNIKKSSFVKKEKFKILNNKSEIFGKNLVISLGLPLPKNSFDKKILTDKYFMSDLYSLGGTKKLIELINSLKNKQKKTVLHFLGSKAGFLECLPELKSLIKNNKINLNIISTSRNATTLQPAIKSENFNEYKFKVFTSKNIPLINSPIDLLKNLKKEFSIAKKNNYFKYDVWTSILQKKILNKVLKNFSKENKKIYNEKYFKKIRSLTRFTFPETVNSFNILKKNNFIRMNKASVLNVIKIGKTFITFTKKISGNIKKVKSDIIISVKGPQNTFELVNSNSLFKSLYKLNKNVIYDDGFATSSNFELINCKNIYLIGFVSSGYNAKRETIVKAINNNATKVINKIIKHYEQ